MNIIPALVTTVILAVNTTINPAPVELSQHQMGLDNRVPGGGYMSDTMADNILLTLAYLDKENIDPKNVDWSKVRENRTIKFKLDPNQVFSFHGDVEEQFKKNFAISTTAHFDSTQGFKSDGYLMGDGVCHLASLLNWTAQDAGLESVAPSNHNFAVIPDVPAKYGAAIYYMPGSSESNQKQNLYIRNTLDKPVVFEITIKDKVLEAQVLKES